MCNIVTELRFISFYFQSSRFVVHSEAHETVSGLYSNCTFLPFTFLLVYKRIPAKYYFMVACNHNSYYYHDSFRRIFVYAD